MVPSVIEQKQPYIVEFDFTYSASICLIEHKYVEGEL